MIVLTAGSGYTSAPAVVIAAPPIETALSIELVPKITVHGENGTTWRVEWSTTLGPGAVWHTLTNLTLGLEDRATVDLASGSSERFYRAVSSAPSAAVNMALVPAGSFQMGDSLGDGFDVAPVHTVTVSAFYMDKYEVTKALWDDVKSWSEGSGYAFRYPGSGKAPNHPVVFINWYDALKWCNARSEKEGRLPAYYTDEGLTQVYKSGEVVPYVNWTAGYRLPTEAEWEKAARGGASGHRFPWSDAETITHDRANYSSDSTFAFDTSPTRGFHPTFLANGVPSTSPVGSFAANGYGFHDMAGNVWEWCWDRKGAYSTEPQTDPHGPAGGNLVVGRGGSFFNNADECRSASRGLVFLPEDGTNTKGFRAVLP